MTSDPQALQEEIRRLGNPDHGGRKWYQYVDFGNGVTTSAGGKLRTETFIDFMTKFDLTKNDRLLDIGSNAGLFCLLCAPRCAHVIGIEYDAAFHKQAMFLKRHFDQTDRDISNVELLNDDVTLHLDRFSDRTVVFASKVLYHKHLGDGVFRVMEAIQKAPVRAIIVQGHTTQGERGQNEGVRTMLSEYGFSFQTVFEHDEYPIGVATRA
jgi:hypothetical protein